MTAIWNEFKAFAFKGNLIDLAIAFVLGVAFTAVITSLVNDIIMPIVGGIVSDKSFAGLTFEFLGVQVFYGNFLTALVYFLIVAWVLFMIIKAINRMQRPAAEEAPATRECPYCLSSIPRLARRCPNCTSEVAPATA
ncbi:MAG TPA: large conductance mechanosensitive channel protein MscL [Thermomicrobiales bacterium]|nr:large conductance mechanosensitive channel protein MscL [Thermomicrobiales bacterium]